MDRNRLLLGGMEDYSQWTVLGSDTAQLRQVVFFSFGPGLGFEKVNSAENKKYAGAYRTISLSKHTSEFSILDRVVWSLYLRRAWALTDIDYAFVRLGTSSSNYIELRYPDSSLTAARLNVCSVQLGNGYFTGAGAKLSDITYLATGIQFDSQDDELDEIYIGEIFLEKTTQVAS